MARAYLFSLKPTDDPSEETQEGETIYRTYDVRVDGVRILAHERMSSQDVQNYEGKL